MVPKSAVSPGGDPGVSPLSPITPTPTPCHNSISSLRPSTFRPPCKAKDRLLLWTPVKTRSPADSNFLLSHKDVDHIREILDLGAWADSTKETYGTGLLAFHTFCDSRNIPDAHRAPANPSLISAFISALAGSYSASAVSNYLSGVRAWHTLHGLKWSLHDTEVDALLKAASALAPPRSKRPPREPYTTLTISAIRDNLDLKAPLHAAVFACLTTAFYTTARTGELTL